VIKMEITDVLILLKKVQDEITEASIALRLQKIHLARIYLGEASRKLNSCLERICWKDSQ